jgi:hypothetical protein
MNFAQGTVYRNIEPLKANEIFGISRMSLATQDSEKNSLIEHIELEGASGHYQWDIF